MLGKKKKARPAATPAGSTRRDDREPARWGAAALGIAVTLGVVALLGAALYAVRGGLLSSPAYSQRTARVSLPGISNQLPPDIARGVVVFVQQAAEGRSVFEDGLTRTVHDRALANPWVASVNRVSKQPNGEVLVEAQYRRPFALVRSAALPAGPLVVVDAQGAVLPIAPSRVRRGECLTIGDVASGPPAAGSKWDAPDLMDGLKLLKLLRPRPYFDQISLIDVRNHDGRSQLEPHIRFWAQVGRHRRTDVRFGRFPLDDLDDCVSPATRLQWLDAIVARHGGRLAGIRNFIELRYDEPYESNG